MTRRGKFAFGGTAAIAALVLSAVVGSGAFGAAVTSASFSGSAGTAMIGGKLYAKQGADLTLRVTTDSDVACVEVIGAHSFLDHGSKTTWSFSLNAGTGEGDKTVTVRAYKGYNANQDRCNGQFDTKTASYTLDNTGPTVTGSRSPAPNGAGWNRGDVNVAWVATDAGSGIASGPTPATDSVTANTPPGGVTRTATATDRVGNSGSGSVIVKLDKNSPVVGGSPSPAPNADGWNNTNVTVSVTCSDALSGVNSCTGGGTKVLSSEGKDQSIPVTAVDNADNQASTNVGPVNIDKTKPSLTGTIAGGTLGDNGWYRSNVAVRWTAMDGLSGIVNAPADSTIAGEGEGLKASNSVADRAGNETSADSPAVKIDKTAPNTDALAPGGWNNVAVAVDLSAHDTLSGVAATHYRVDGGEQQTGTQVSLSDEGEYTLEYWSVDLAGNPEPHKTVDVRIDKTSPTITHAFTPLANANGWFNRDVTVTFTCEDSLSGIESCGPDRVISEEGKDQDAGGKAVDNAGNTATDPATVSLDKTAPTIDASVDREPNGNNWYDADVTVSFVCGDALSGVDKCPVAKVLGEGADQSAGATVADAAGNNATDGVEDINVDKTAPELSGKATTEPNDQGWYKNDVVVAWTASDGLSGLDGDAPADSKMEGEGDNLSASASVKDKAGNAANATVDRIKIDRTAPATTVEVANPLESGWYAAAVKVTLTGVDSLSGVDRTLYSVDGGEPRRYDGAFDFGQKGTHTITFWSVDNAGNEENADDAGHSVTLKIDDIAPSIAGSRTPAANDFGWNNGPVTVTFDCSDAESGIAECTDPVTLSGEGEGQSVVGDARDNAGNTASAKVEHVNIDLTLPELSGAVTTEPNEHGWYNGDVTVAWTANDALSGIDPETKPADSTVSGEGDDLGATASVKDRASNEGHGSVSAIKIDRTKPEVTASKPEGYSTGWYAGAVKVTLTSTDDRSGVDQVRYTVDDGQTEVYGAEAGLVVGEKGVHTVRYWSVDKAGNVGDAKELEVKIDGIEPTITAARVPGSEANEHGWNNGDVVVHFECADAETEISGCEPDATLKNEGADQSVTGTAIDAAGNTASHTLGGVNIDKTPPTLTGRPASDANGAGWYRGDVIVEWTAVDGLSGVDPETKPADSTINGEGEALGATASVKDKAGNEVLGEVSGIKIDRTPPTIDGKPTTEPNGAGWYSGPVTVAFTCKDNLSGVATCPTEETVGGNLRDQSVTSGVATDRAGNEVTGKRVDGINIDALAPTTLADTTCTRVNDWCTGDEATVKLIASDQLGLSGVHGIRYQVNGGAEQYAAGQTTSVAVPLNGEGEATVRYWAVDYAGNVEEVKTASLKWDNIAPVVTPVLSPMPNVGGWHHDDVTVHFLATDMGSGVKDGSVTPDIMVSGETGSKWLVGEALDNADNKGSAKVEVKLDKTAPGIAGSVTAGQKGNNGWYRGPVTVGFTCDDALSGIAACAEPITLTDNKAGQSATGATEDEAGNTQSATVGGIDIDAVKPTITLKGITPGAIHTLGAVPAASCTAHDALSGPDGCDVKVTGGVASGAGTFTFTATARDKAGNVGTVTGTYRVVYAWDGFKQPISAPGHQTGASTSIFKAGSTVPVKLGLSKADGSVVQPASAPKWITPVKGAAMSAPVDEALYGAVADSGSTYRLEGDKWQYNWGTPKAGAGSYWRIGVTLDDGQTYSVNIGLK